MAIAPKRAASGLDDHDFDAGALVRTAFWGIGAAGALLLAVLAGLSETGSRRVGVAVTALVSEAKAFAGAPARPVPTRVAAAKPSPEPHLRLETRRLQEQVRLLAADRDRLARRVSVLEHNLEDVTGSVRHQESLAKEALVKAESARAAAAATQASPAPPIARTAVMTPSPNASLSPARPTPLAEDPSDADALADVTASVPSQPPPPPSRRETEAEPIVKPPATKLAALHQARSATQTDTPASRGAYGVDLGGAISVDRLRLLWQALQSDEAKLLHGLHPVTRARGLKRGGRPDVRLIAGPLPNADEAAKLCAAILDAGRYCEPAAFHGQRLSSH